MLRPVFLGAGVFACLLSLGAQTPPSIETRTTGMQKLDGFFPLYWEEKTGALFLEIPRFDSEFLYSTGLAAGLGSNDIAQLKRRLQREAIGRGAALALT